MEQMKTKKIIAMLIVFVIVFSNFGYTLSAIATTNGFEVITHAFLGKEEISFEAYFEENEEKVNEKISDVNETIEIKMKLTPEIEGYLKNATIKAICENKDVSNFKIKDIRIDSKDVAVKQESNKIENLVSGEIIEEENTVSNEVKNELVENLIPEEEQELANKTVEVVELDEKANVIANETLENILEGNANEIESKTKENISKHDIDNIIEEVDSVKLEIEGKDENVLEELTEKDSEEEKEELEGKEEDAKEENPTQIEEEEKLVDEEKIIEEKSIEAEQEIIDFTSDVKIVSENEVSISNVVEEKVYILEIEYVQPEEFYPEELYKDIYLQLSGTFINNELEKIEVKKEEKLTIGWKYSKDIEINSEYTKVSPFKIGEINGTIVENKITLKREVEEEKSLPIKKSEIEVEVPKFNGNLPIEVSILANKLLATKGEDVGEVVFGEENWNYDKENGKIKIIVNNEKDGKIQNSSGEDEYTIIYRFEEYTEDIVSKLDRNIVATVEQYSGKENKIIKKEIKDNQEIGVNVGEIVSYSIGSTEEKIEKSRIYANYNSEESLYETEYTSNVTLNVLTSEMLESIKIDSSKEVYKDINGFEFEAKEVLFRKIKFNYSEIKHILEQGGNIEIYNLNGEVIVTLDKNTIQTEEDCIINLKDTNGIKIQINNIETNGTINFEITKVIKKCNYEKSAFKNFRELESKITAEVKYRNIEETLTLGEISTAKELKESYTRANIYINKEDLKTIEDNENVEIKIELNNDKPDSDLYINPSFELVFPKYVKDVSVEGMNILYDNGLRISDFHTYTESDIVKMKVEFSGVQKTFSENTITNGTNIVMNLKIKVDDYTPTKQDQIKLYYCNEGVSNYESQTKWTIRKNIPNGILKTTNGFDVAIIKYQAPNGMIAINGIENYDGQLSSVQSVKQGEKMELIPREADSRVTTMELLALNNTGNECSDIVMIGRIPFKGNRDVITNKDIGTTTTAMMQGFIKEDIQNFNMTTIYYSKNENANKDLSDSTNGWRTAEQVENINEIKSFLIEVKGNMLPGAVLRYTYEFEIPENLPYETSIAGSFGIYYNNNTEVAVVYESASADKVGLKTEAGPKIEANLSVDIGDGAEVGEARFLNYTLKVKNTGSVVAENVTVTNPIPYYTSLYEYTENNGYGNNNYVESNKNSLEWKIENLEPEEEKIYTYKLKTKEIPDIYGYYSDYLLNEDEQGYYYEKENQEGNVDKIYVEENFKISVKNKAQIKVENLAINQESNTVINPIKKMYFDIEVNNDCKGIAEVGGKIYYYIRSKNISDKDLKNIEVEINLPDNIEYVQTKVGLSNHGWKSAQEDIVEPKEEFDSKNIIYNKELNKVIIKIDEFYNKEELNITIEGIVIKSDLETKITTVAYKVQDIAIEEGPTIPVLFKGPKFKITQDTNLVENIVLEGNEVEFLVTIENLGNEKAENINLKSEVSQNLTDISANITGDLEDGVNTLNNKIDKNLYSLKSNGKIVLKIKGRAVELDKNEEEKIITSKVNLSANHYDEIETEELKVIIRKNPEKENTNVDSNNNEANNNQKNNEDQEENKEHNNNNNNQDKVEDGNAENISNSNNENKEEVNNKEVENKIEKTYSLSGTAWLDSNKNGVKEKDEKLISSLKVQLLKSGIMIKTTATDGKGRYEFANLTKGNYSIKYVYDGERYTVTTYKNNKVEDNLNSEAIESTSGNAVSNNITISSDNITDINIGLIEKEKFNLSINKYISSAKLKTNKREETYKYDNLQLGKMEIKAKELQDAVVTLEYVIVVKNDGEISGKVTSIIDYLPKDMHFDISRNEGWFLGEDGNVYNDSLKDINIKPGEEKQIKLILTKNMTEDNTGVIVNKIAILNTENKEGVEENKEDNGKTQEMLILVSTGKTINNAIILVSVIIIGICIVLKNKKNFINLKKKKYR